MRFEVPQFIEVEDKIVGPLSFRQFVYVAGSIGFAVLMYIWLPLFLAIIISAPVLILGAALAFYKINDRPFITILEAAINYTLKNKLYIWKKKEREPEKAKQATQTVIQAVPKLSGNRLKDLAWSLDIKESMYSDKNQVT